MGPIKNNQDLTIGFVRDQNDEDEFYLEIVMKAKNPKTGNKEILRIAVDDIDEIEHVEGTYQFYIHYQAKVADDAASSITGFIKKKIGSKSKGQQKEERSELFESKFVKQFIETFNNVIGLMEDQEKEIREYVGFEPEKKEEEVKKANVKSPAKQVQKDVTVLDQEK